LGSPPALANKILRCAATIVDLKNAADNGGAVNYSFDVVILTPTDPAKANGRLLCEVVSRGRTIALAALQDSNTMDIYNAVRPVMPAEAKGVVRGKGAGNAFLLNQGYTIVLSGWQGDRPEQFRTDKPAAIARRVRQVTHGRACRNCTEARRPTSTRSTAPLTSWSLKASS